MFAFQNRGITHSSVFFIWSAGTVKKGNKSTTNFLNSPKAQVHLVQQEKKIVTSDFTATCLPISGPPTCQERPKYSVMLMKRICSSRPEFLTSGLTSSLRLIMFQVALEKYHPVFLKALLSPGLVSPVRSLSPQIKELILSPESPSTAVCYSSICHFLCPLFLFFLFPLLPFPLLLFNLHLPSAQVSLS